MKYYIMLGTLITDHKYSESEAKEKAIQYKKNISKNKSTNNTRKRSDIK